MFKNISIKVKLLLILAVSLMGLALGISVTAIQKSSKALLDDKFAQLSTMEVSKHGELKKYFSNLGNLLISLASNKGTQDSFLYLRSGFNSIDKDITLDKKEIQNRLILEYEVNYLNKVHYNIPKVRKKDITINYLPKNINALKLQYIFIADNNAPVGQKNALSHNEKYKSRYMIGHEYYHKIYNKFLKSFGLYDIFLIDLNGDIIYSVDKEKDFATNLKTDIYKDTGLSRVYHKALKSKQYEIAFEDFAPYEPSYNKPESFLATPIFIDGKKVGVLAFQMSVERLNNIMQFGGDYKKAGLGDTGECYLVGSDYLMRTDSRFKKDIKDKLIRTLDTTVGILKVKTKSTQAVISGEEKIGKWIIKDYRGKDVLSVYHVVDIFNTTKWALVAELNKNEALEPTIKLQNSLKLIIFGILVLSMLLTFYFIEKLILKPLNVFQGGLSHFFKFLKDDEKDIKLLDISLNDEIGKMSKSVNEGIVQIKQKMIEKDDEYWISEGVEKLNAIIIDTSYIKDVTTNTLKFISKYLDVTVGVIYLYNQKQKELKLNATYAYSKTNNTKETYVLGDGIVGQVGLQNTPIILTQDIKADTNMIIQTGILQKLPTSIYTYPLIYQNQLFGVIELGSLKEFDTKRVNFLSIVTKIIATAMSTALQNEKVANLLEQSKKDNENLEYQQQRLEEANANMEEQQQQLEMANANMEEQQQQLEEINAHMEEQQQKLEIQNHDLEKTKKDVLKKANDLELSNKYKTEFLANMSHELRTPLNAIILLSQLLGKNKQQNLNADDVKKAKTIYTSGNELLTLINDILDLSKVEAGKIDVIVDNFSPSSLLENLENLYIFNATQKGLEFNIVDNYKDMISSDRNRISQILKNLISNALKFTHKGVVTVQINKSNNEKLPIQIIVSDTGVGIPKEKQKQIFEAFTQADGSTSRQYGGTGLGLSITKELSSLLGGNIQLESFENEGSKFTINLPNLSKDNFENTIDIKEISPRQDIEQIKKEHILIQNHIINDDKDIVQNNSALLVIDDDSSFCDVVYEMIKKHDRFGLIAHTGKDGLNILDNYNISGLLLDLTLPDIDGIEILQKVKSNPILKDIPVYIISSRDKDEKFIKMGAKGYGQKPLLEDDIEDIIIALDEFIRNHKDIDNDEKKEKIIVDDIDLKNINILVVDDDIKNIFVLDNILNEYNANVFTSYNGKEAIETLKNNNHIDIVLMDIMMPVMNGYEAIETIRADDKLKNIPIIAVTAKAMKEDKEKCISIGADDFVSKPFDMDALISLVKVWSDKKHR